MSIYDNSFTPKERVRTNKPSQKVDTKKILNDKDLTSVVKRMKNGPKTAKEIIYDIDGNVVGILQRSGEPYLFDDKQVKEFLKLKGE
jgi:hypothetical protein